MMNDIDFRKHFGTKLNTLRKQKGLTQSELAFARITAIKRFLNGKEVKVYRIHTQALKLPNFLMYRLMNFFLTVSILRLPQQRTTKLNQFSFLFRLFPCSVFSFLLL